MSEDGCVVVTGGAGFIGSHTVVMLLQVGYHVVSIDNHCNSSPTVYERIGKIVGTDAMKRFSHYELDVAVDVNRLGEVFAKHSPVSSVIHFAALKSVGESVRHPLQYYRNNITSALNIVDVMMHFNVSKLVFSSSATVYGDPDHLPVGEDAPTSATNPYGQTKLMMERILIDHANAVRLHNNSVTCDDERKHFRVILLRYFNPVGAHPSGLIGEDPKGIPNNLMPFVLQVAIGRRPHLGVFGSDWPTPDGTGVRDYLHVQDLADGHICALKHMDTFENGSHRVYNLGTGKGSSVLEVVEAMKQASGKDIAYNMMDRRDGDVAACWADATRAKVEMKWVAKLTLDDMCRDAWNWQLNNPNGYSAL